MTIARGSWATDERFVFGDVIGRGAMGEVFRAHDRRMGCDVAAKTLQDLAPEQVYQLKREFRILSGVAHPNLVELFELVIDGRGGFFTMELLDGAGFLDHVRGRGFGENGAGRMAPPSGEELARLREALRQLAAGLATLHACDRLHCDIKPANVMVTRRGRVVLLDFGLAASLRPDEAQRAEPAGFVGTLEYVAPEQAWNEPLSPATDWYSVGVMTYQALTGCLPFEGSTPAQLVMAKKGRRPPPPSALVSGIPEELDRIVEGLLDPDPRRRPSPEEIATSLTQRPASVLVKTGSSPAFVGRALELSRALALHAEVRSGATALVHVHGVSGLGKTAFVRELIRRSEASGPFVALQGRCHPQESVPYKGLDGIIDMLGRFVASSVDDGARGLIPDDAAALGRLFPVLRAIPGWPRDPATDEALAPQELRRRAIAALRTMLVAISATQPVLLWIDDVQWSDPDTVALLADLLGPPALPRVLWVLSYRRAEMTEDTLARTKGFTSGPVHDVALAPLDPAEIATLAGALLRGSASTADRHVATISAESAGNPFLIGELARWLVAHAGEPGGAQLTDVVRDRVGALPVSARRLLEVVSLAGRPLSRGLALTAAGLLDDPAPVIPHLRWEQLLKGTAAADGGALEPAHDRIREAVVEALSAEQRKACHRGLAAAFEARSDTDPEVLVEHLLGAGEREKARGPAVAAADRASATLAFNRAARHYRLAIDLGAGGDSPWSLREKLGAALASAARTAESAEAYEDAAAELARRNASHPALLAMRRSAAEQHLRGGHVDRGLAVLRDVLAATGVRYPETTAEAVATILALRGYVLVRGFRPNEGKTPAAAGDLAKMDACWSACLGLNMIDILRSAVFQARHASLALHGGDTRHTLRALGPEMCYTACEGGRAKRERVKRIQACAAEVAKGSGDPEGAAFVELCVGAALYFEGRFREALPQLDAAEAVCRQRHDGITWEVANCRMYRVWSLAWLGELGELGRLVPALVDEARGQHNILALAGLASTHGNLLWLAAGHPEEARARADEAVRPFPAASFQSPHYFDLIAQVRIDLYQGDDDAAFRRMEEAWPKLRAIQFLRMQLFRVELCYLRALAALAASWRRSGTARNACLAIAGGEGRRLAREDLPCAKPLALLVEAGLAAAHGRAAEAARRMEEAARAADVVGMGLHAAGARVRVGDRAGEVWMKERGVARAEAMVGAVAPALDGARRG